jgi:hypothetical protein
MQRGSKLTGLDADRLGGHSVAGDAPTTKSKRRGASQEVSS